MEVAPHWKSITVQSSQGRRAWLYMLKCNLVSCCVPNSTRCIILKYAKRAERGEKGTFSSQQYGRTKPVTHLSRIQTDLFIEKKNHIKRQTNVGQNFISYNFHGLLHSYIYMDYTVRFYQFIYLYLQHLIRYFYSEQVTEVLCKIKKKSASSCQFTWSSTVHNIL